MHQAPTHQPCAIFDDPRQITSIWWGDAGSGHYLVRPGEDQGSCTAIIAYCEPGAYANVPWLAVYYGDHIHARVPAHQVTIVYAAEPSVG